MGCEDEARKSTARLLSALDALCTASGVETTHEEQDLAVRSAVREYAQHDDWHHFAFWGRTHYVRNLVMRRDGLYEVLVICWAPGQGSRVHNHGASQCWMTCLSGAVSELRYKAEEDKNGGGSDGDVPCPTLRLASTTVLPAGATAHICDAVGLHSVKCAHHRGAVTLHVYCPPIRSARLFEPDVDRVTVRAPGHVSVAGQLIGGDGGDRGKDDIAGPAPWPPVWL